jgi:acetyl-CoA acetyltransferase
VSAFIVGIGETPRLRHPDVSLTAAVLMRDAVQLALVDSGLALQDIDGLAVASFTLEPDRAIDFAWRAGLTARWLLQDPNGGAAGLNMLSHAVAAIQTDAASNILIVAGDVSSPQTFRTRANNYNSATRDHLAPLGFGGPSASFAMLTKRQMRRFGLTREDYGHLAIAQRQAAMGNPLAAYRTPLTMDEYLNAPIVADPLGRFDCVPIVAGASALIVSGKARRRAQVANAVRIVALRQSFNPDHQNGDGLETGIRNLAQNLWNAAGVSPSEIDVTSVYDDFPAMAYAQLADLGFVTGDDIARFARDRIASRTFAVNTGGGMLSAGQAGCAAGLQGIVEVVRQLQRRGGDRQVPGARLGVASAYGMVLYRYCACSGAVVLAREEAP